MADEKRKGMGSCNESEGLADDLISMVDMNLVDWIRGGTEETAGRGPECPDDQQLAAFVDDRLAPEDRSRLREHLADCDHCLRTAAFLSRNAGAERLATVPASLAAAAREKRFSRAPASRLRVMGRWAAAAALLALTTVAIWRIDSQAGPGPDSAVRSPATSDLPSALLPEDEGRGPRVVFPSAGATIPRAGVDFRWTPIPTAVSYRVRVVTLDGDVVWEKRVFGTETSLPAEVRLAPGEPYLVRVSAQLAGGKTLASGHLRFFVRSP